MIEVAFYSKESIPMQGI